MKANWKNRTLFHGENLDFLRAMDSETVDLIATDPPFNKGRDFHATPESLAKGASFQDRWSWDRDVHEEWVDQIKDDHSNLMEIIGSVRKAHSDAMGAFMCFLAVRLLAMHRLLKPTGSIFLHCDPTASHYIKAVMDAIFGTRNFRNEIVWHYNKWSNGARCFQKNHDLIFWYAKSKDARYNTQYDPPTARQLELRKAGYNLGSNSSGKIVRIYDREHPEVKKRMGGWIEEGRSIQYVDQPLKGKPMADVWKIAALNGQAKERTGYPTQKPLALYERIIESASDEGDIVLDPFAGCATTCVAAERTRRQWVGIDLWEKVASVIHCRIKKECLELLDEKITFTSTLPVRRDDGRTAAPHLKPKVVMQKDTGPKMSNAEMKAKLIEVHDIVCQGCGRVFDSPEYLELDHKLPRSDGGANSIENRTLLCKPCNGLKSNDKTMGGLLKAIKKAAKDPDNKRHAWAKQSPVLNGKT